MRILQINAVYKTKSTGLIMHDIHQTLKKAGESSFIAHPGKSCGDSNEIIIGNKFDYKLHAILTRIAGLQGFASVLSTSIFLKRIHQISPDVIHLHNIHSNFLNYKMLLKYTAKWNIPIVMTLHDCWFFTGKCYHFLDVGCQKYRTGCRDCPKRKMDIPSYLLDTSSFVFRVRRALYAKNKLYVVGCSKWISEIATSACLFKQASITQIYNGIDLTIFKPQPSDLRIQKGLNGKFIIMTMANKWFEPENQQIRSCITENLKNDDVIMVVGCNENQMDQDNESIRYIGYIKGRNDLAKLYTISDLFLNLTMVDTLPTVNMEAAGCGTPVVTYDSGGSAELVNNGETGYVVKPNDEKQLLFAIQNVKDGRISREKCREWAKKNFDKNDNYQEYLTLYRRIIQETRNQED